MQRKARNHLLKVEFLLKEVNFSSEVLTPLTEHHSVSIHCWVWESPCLPLWNDICESTSGNLHFSQVNVCFYCTWPDNCKFLVFAKQLEFVQCCGWVICYLLSLEHQSRVFKFVNLVEQLTNHRVERLCECVQKLKLSVEHIINELGNNISRFYQI